MKTILNEIHSLTSSKISFYSMSFSSVVWQIRVYEFSSHRPVGDVVHRWRSQGYTSHNRNETFRATLDEVWMCYWIFWAASFCSWVIHTFKTLSRRSSIIDFTSHELESRAKSCKRVQPSQHFQRSHSYTLRSQTQISEPSLRMTCDFALYATELWRMW